MQGGRLAGQPRLTSTQHPALENLRNLQQRDRRVQIAHIPTPHAARIAITFTHVAEPIRCEATFALQDSSDAIFAAPLATANAVWAAWLAHVVPAMPAETIWNGVVFEDVRTLPFGGADYPQTATPGGTSFAGASIPTDSCISIKKLTAGLGRSARGRMFWPIWVSGQLVTADTTSGALVAAAVAALNGFQTALQTALTPAEVGIISTQVGGAPRSTGLFQQIVGYSAADLNVDSQRRRLLGRGS